MWYWWGLALIMGILGYLAGTGIRCILKHGDCDE
jgi:hypothetical protein